MHLFIHYQTYSQTYCLYHRQAVSQLGWQTDGRTRNQEICHKSGCIYRNFKRYPSLLSVACMDLRFAWCSYKRNRWNNGFIHFNISKFKNSRNSPKKSPSPAPTGNIRQTWIPTMNSEFGSREIKPNGQRQQSNSLNLSVMMMMMTKTKSLRMVKNLHVHPYQHSVYYGTHRRGLLFSKQKIVQATNRFKYWIKYSLKKHARRLY